MEFQLKNIFFIWVIFLSLSQEIFSKKILYITDDLFSLESIPLINQIKGLADKGCIVSVFNESESNKDYDYICKKIEEYNLEEKIFFSVLPHDIGSYDIVICANSYLAYKYRNIKLKFKNNVTFISIVRGEDIIFCKSDWNNNLVELFTIADLFLPVCEHTKYCLVQQGCIEDKIKVLYESVDIQDVLFRIKIPYVTEKVNILFYIDSNQIDQMKILKNVLIGKKLFKYNLCFTVLYKKSMNEENLKLIDLYKKEYPTITFLEDILSRNDYLKILDSHHICICIPATQKTGVQKSIPIIIKEAMAKGLIVIATRHGGIPEVIRLSENGYLVPERQYSEIIHSISSAINNYMKWPSKILTSREIIENEHSKKTIVNKLYNIIELM